MERRVITYLIVTLIFIHIAANAFGKTKISPSQAEPGHPFTIIDTSQRRLLDGSVAEFRSAGWQFTVNLRTHKPFNTAHGRLPLEMHGGEYTVCVRPPKGDEIQIGSLIVFGPTAPPPLITPYKDEADIIDIQNGYSSFFDPSIVPWGFVHDGFDIYPKNKFTPFQAVCSGRVHWMYTGSEQVSVMLSCDSTYTAEYNFETQSPNTGQAQLGHLDVDVGQTVLQGEPIGKLFAAGDDAHVHFSLHRNWIPTCPEPYFSPAAASSMLYLLHKTYPTANLCYGGNVTPPPLFTPYVDESDMEGIYAGFSSENTVSPWGFANDGIDIYPKGDQKLFQASCSGMVDNVQLLQTNPGSNWQVEVLIQCENYVYDPLLGGYFIPFSVDYIFKPMSNDIADGISQLGAISVSEGDLISQGTPIGKLHTANNPDAHVHFGVVQFGSSSFSALGVPSIPLCPEPHFSQAGRDSILNLLHVAWPNANMCYQD